MFKKIIQFCFILHLACTPMHVYTQVSTREFTTAELQEDFRVFRSRLEQHLANLYLYTPKPRLDAVFDSLYSTLHTMTEREFFCHISYIQSFIRDGHSNIYPSQQSRDAQDAHAGFFPFQVYWDGSKMKIVRDQSDEVALIPGCEIISINGMPAAAIMQYMISREVRDGDNTAYPVWIINNYFRSYYSFFFGNPATYTIRYRDNNMVIAEKEVPALTRAAIKKNNESRYPVITETGISADTVFSAQYGLLSIRSWDQDLLREKYHQRFRSAIDDAFAKFNRSGITHLIIDLRNNQGGDAANGIYLAARLLDRPFTYVRSVEAVKSHTDTGQLLVTRNESMVGSKQPAEQVFSGKVYVLINGGSFSNSAIFTQLMRETGRAVVIGTETGGSNNSITGSFGAAGQLRLPNTGIFCDRTDHRIGFGDPAAYSGRGVQPDRTVITTAEDIIQGRDPVLDLVKKLIRQQ